MSRAFAEYKQASFTSDGTYYMSYNITFVEPSLQFVETHEIVVTILATDSALAMQNKITAAIKVKGTELGLPITNSEITQPAYTKG